MEKWAWFATGILIGVGVGILLVSWLQSLRPRDEREPRREVWKFLWDLLDPEMYGCAVTPEVRDAARILVGLNPCETKRDVRHG